MPPRRAIRPRPETRTYAPSGSRTSSLDRAIFFSDGVHAIAITLLVLQITVPAVSGDRLGSALVDHSSEYFAYGLSFVVIGFYWLLHHRVFDVVIRQDRVMLRLNLLVLACIAFLPFPTAVIGRYGGQEYAVVAYAASLAATGAAWYALWWWVSHGRRLIDDTLTDREIAHVTVHRIATPVVFAASIPIALVNPAAAEYSWLALVPITWALRRRYAEDLDDGL